MLAWWLFQTVLGDECGGRGPRLFCSVEWWQLGDFDGGSVSIQCDGREKHVCRPVPSSIYLAVLDFVGRATLTFLSQCSQPASPEEPL